MTLQKLNGWPDDVAFEHFFRCCGSSSWAHAMVKGMPYPSIEALMEAAGTHWGQASRADALEAFSHHPKIGGVDALAAKFASTAQWAQGEQSAVKKAGQETLQALADGNEAYEKKFGYIFIVCASGKSADEMLSMLQARLPNAPDAELAIAMAEQHKITLIRLTKLLAL